MDALLAARVKALRQRMRAASLDALLITSAPNVAYISGFEDSESLIFLTHHRLFFITDSRYVEEAEETLCGVTIVLMRSSAYTVIDKLRTATHVKRIGFEAAHLPFAIAQRLMGSAKKSPFVPTQHLVEAVRAVKDRDEIARIRRAGAIAEDVLHQVCRHIPRTMTERSLSRIVQTSFIERGAYASFDPIVAAGRNTSKPHAKPGTARIGTTGPLMFDLGAKYDHYCSDITVTLLRAKTPQKLREISVIVHEARRAALEALRPGAPLALVDAAARSLITRAGFGDCFGHSLGHGVGREVHEEPTISRSASGELATGMVVTIEPAIYLPGIGGVRVEDMALITTNGYELLTRGEDVCI